MLDQWQTSILMSIFKNKDDLRNCYAYSRDKLLVHPMNIVERVLERKI